MNSRSGGKPAVWRNCGKFSASSPSKSVYTAAIVLAGLLSFHFLGGSLRQDVQLNATSPPEQQWLANKDNQISGVRPDAWRSGKTSSAIPLLNRQGSLVNPGWMTQSRSRETFRTINMQKRNQCLASVDVSSVGIEINTRNKRFAKKMTSAIIFEIIPLRVVRRWTIGSRLRKVYQDFEMVAKSVKTVIIEIYSPSFPSPILNARRLHEISRWNRLSFMIPDLYTGLQREINRIGVPGFGYSDWAASFDFRLLYKDDQHVYAILNPLSIFHGQILWSFVYLSSWIITSIV